MPWWMLWIGTALVWLAVACGAEDKVAPRAPEEASSPQCSGFEDQLPRLLAAVRSGKTEGLRKVVEEQLLVGARPDDPPPINSVLRVIFGTLNRFAQMPPEPSAPSGQVCATEPPSIEQVNPLCEARRAMDLLVHEGKGIEWLRLVDPQVAGTMNYIIGRAPSSSTPHYEVATVVANMCQQNASCQLSDTLDLVIAISAFAGTVEGAEALAHIEKMVKNPALQPFLVDEGAQYGGEAGIVALIRVVVNQTLGMDDPSALDSLPIDQLPQALRPDFEEGVGYLKKLLDPRRKPNALTPLKRVLHCHSTQDPNMELVRMLYRLGLERKLPEFGLTRMAETLKGLREADQRGTLLYLTRMLATSVRGDESAIDAAASVCRTLFSTKLASGQARSNAEQVLPVVADLFAQGAAAELLCASDSLIYGCSGGTRPACAAQ